MGEITVEINGKERSIEIKKNSIRVDSLLKSLEIYPETAVVVKDKTLLCDDDRVHSGEKIKIVIATSKG
ncbi:thiamine biosynthesis protein ThiS [Desulfurobacterium atlanticum]|uniref:Sulfur carrier protein n=1 Tax=Desulfurobacterium atlanticum TaxID=240169 RepID=A0A238YIR0_9BACT|nr:thiamine biosynthesis protein ThiS [Desulfurobacterium atlanticum]SNR70688.1 sulfur carrier protein [Desulfurobacterium atlanticum]